MTVRARSGRPVEAITLAAVTAGEVGIDDIRIHPDTLRAQAEVAAAHGNPQLAANLLRAAVLALLPDDRILAIYEALRPRRSTHAELLAAEGSSVDLCVNGLIPGEVLPLYVRDTIAGALHRRAVRVTNYARLYGSDGDTVFFQHTASALPMPFEAVDTLVLCLGHVPETSLEADLRRLRVELHLAGDCLTPRTAEEAVYEGLLAGAAL